MTAAALWTAVVAAYDEQSLVELTRVNDTSNNSINTTAGQSAAQHVIDLWALHAQVDYDSTDSAHVAVGIRATIAVLWERGGVSSQAAKVEWDEVYGDGGLMEKLRRTGARGRMTPASNAPDRTSSGKEVQPWSKSVPNGIYPNDSTVE